MSELPEIVSLLAEASHETWMRQKERDQGIPRDQLESTVPAHDIERAQDAVRILERGGFLSSRRVRHWHKEPAASTPEFVASVPLMETPKGLKAVIEITAYAEGTKVSVATSVVEGPNHNRTIRQKGSLMFNDLDEAKDAIDAIVDHLEEEAKRAGRN